MIIWGSKSREKVESQGEFHCPNCDGEKRNYSQIKVSSYFTLYFIPLFPTETLGRYVKCQTCETNYNEDVLEYVPPTAREKLQYEIYQDLISGMPAQMIIRKLRNQDWTPQEAEEIVYSVTDRNHRVCPNCHFDFHEQVENCSSCGADLPQAQAAQRRETIL
ncbi:zinc-ribbon domain-containing protein [Leminorella grimontii]|uniref:zinc-ribbon domain-containing protein n=1 Tax=Leminorella grimontii TaxID=82981 RepID=UPI003220795F